MKGQIYIISYFGNSMELKNFRREKHKEQVNFWLKETNYDILIYANEYEKDDFIKDERIQYIKSKKLTNASQSRNILLQEFYNSNNDFGIFLDNDSILNKEFSDLKVENYFNLNNQVDIFCPVNPRCQPYKKLSEFEKMDLNKFYLFKYELGNFYGSIFYMRNIKKVYNKEIYFDEKIINLEDRDFAYTCMFNNISVFINFNCVFKDLSNNKSTINLIDTQEKRIQENIKSKKYLCKKHNLKMNEKMRIFSLKEKDKYCKRLRRVIISKNNNNLNKYEDLK